MPPEVAWVDTGAPLTVFPESVWRKLGARILAPNVPLAIAGQSLAANVGEAWLAVSDAANHVSPTLPVRAYLSPSNDLPVLLGVEDVLTAATLHCEHASRRAFLDFA